MINCASFYCDLTEKISFLDEAQLPGTTQDHLQIFNIEAKAKMKSHQMPEQVCLYKHICFKYEHMIEGLFIKCCSTVICFVTGGILEVDNS